MNQGPAPEHAPPLVKHLIELADEIDGVADFGMTVCFLKEEIAGRHSYIEQRCASIRRIVEAVIAALNETSRDNVKELPALQSELVAATDQFLAAFRSLERFRSLRPDSVRSWAEAARTGWETIHGVVLRIAESRHLLDQSWYFPILQRHDAYRTQFDGIAVCFYESAVASKTEQNPQGSEVSE